MNVRSVKTLSTVLFCISSLARIASFFFHDDLVKLPNYHEFNISNFVQITGSFLFLLLSRHVLKNNNWTVGNMNVLVMVFCVYVLSTTFAVSYIFSMHNTKNTLAVFLIGIVFVGVFFALDIKQIAFLSGFVIVLFISAMVTPSLSIQEKFLNVIASLILALALYTCGRYSYYFKSEHFLQLLQLQEKNAEIEVLNNQKREILTFVAHDLRAPLNNIESLCAILINEISADHISIAQMIQNSAMQGKNIIHDLIEVAQEEKAPLLVERTDLELLLQAICKKWEANMDMHRKIEFLSNGNQAYANVNISKLTRVLDNLIGNGLKFSPASSPIFVELLQYPDLYVIKVKDFGIGIPVALQKMLFDQFSKAGRQGLNGERSLGLGLHISKNIIEEHGGSLRVESQEDKGTTFVIELPVPA